MARSSSGKAPRPSTLGATPASGAGQSESGRVTPRSAPTPARSTNWVLVVVVVLVLVGLIGGFFVALVAGGGAATSTTLPATLPG
ncbi:MAG: hypothetical protein ACK4V6_04445 [Microthrixaceae bacterium]